MAYLLDTNILVRLANPADPDYTLTNRTVEVFLNRGEVLHVTPQNLLEFRAVATRPKAVNGLGATAAEAEAHTATFEKTFPLLPDTPDIFPAWKAVVVAAGVIGKQVHDARLVAVCHVHTVSHLLTFNTAHFVRLAGVSPGLVVVEPTAV